MDKKWEVFSKSEAESGEIGLKVVYSPNLGKFSHFSHFLLFYVEFLLALEFQMEIQILLENKNRF